MKKLLTFIFTLTFALIYTQESVLLRIDYKKGDIYTIKMNQVVNSTLALANTKTDMTMEVIDVVEGVYTSKMTFNKMVINVDQNGMKIFYDTSKKAENLDQMGQMMKTQIDSILKAVITHKINKRGKVLETKIEPSSIPNSDQFKNQAKIVYPEKALKVSDTWSTNTNLQGANILVEYKVTEITSDKVMLSSEAKISGVGEGNLIGTYQIDRATGVPLKSIIKSNMKIQGQDLSFTSTIDIKKM